jgi:hypothetical protein
MKLVALTFFKKLPWIGLIVLTLILVGSIDPVFAQPPGMPEAPSQAPIDGGLGILAVSAGAYGLKKLRDKQKK